MLSATELSQKYKSNPNFNNHIFLQCKYSWTSKDHISSKQKLRK